jgi:hypothetical protein
MLNLFQYLSISVSQYFSNQILKRVQDDGVFVIYKKALLDY